MARRWFPQERTGFRAGTNGQALTSIAGTAVTVYTAETGGALANLLDSVGAAVTGSVLTFTTDSLLPDFQGPSDDTDTLWGLPAGGTTRYRIDARVDDRVDALAAADTAEAVARAAADALLIPLTQRGAVSGVATLDASGTVPDAQIPATIARDAETTAAVAAHAAAADPHPVYMTAAEVSGSYARSKAWPGNRGTYGPLAVPVPDGNNNVGHPTWVRVPGGLGVEKYPFWMSYTPYPPASRENPCVVASHDGVNWEVPDGGVLTVCPLSEATALGYTAQADPELVWHNSTLKLFYKMIYGGGDQTYEALVLKTTTDGITWSAPTVVLTGRIGVATIVAQGIVVEADNTLSMWHVDNEAGDPRPIRRRTSSDGGLTWSAPTTITYPTTTSSNMEVYPWHISVYRVQYDLPTVNSVYYLLSTDREGGMSAWSSTNGLTFTGSPGRILAPTGPYDARGWYRASMLPSREVRPQSVYSPGAVLFDVIATAADGSGANINADNWRLVLYRGLNLKQPTTYPARSSFKSRVAYIYSDGAATPQATGTSFVNAARYVRIRVPKRMNVTGVGVDLTVTGGAGATVRVGLYYDEGGFPIGPNMFEGVIDVNAAALGAQFATASLVLDPGDYWAIAIGQGTNLASLRYSSATLVGSPVLTAYNFSAGLAESGTWSGALPTGPNPTTSNSAPIIALRGTFS